MAESMLSKIVKSLGAIDPSESSGGGKGEGDTGSECAAGSDELESCAGEFERR